MDRNRNKHEKRGGLVEAPAEAAQADDIDDIWILFEHEAPPDALFRKMKREGLAMLNPKKANSYHVRGRAAHKLVKALGDGWGIENNEIVRTLPYKIHWGIEKDRHAAIHSYLKEVRKALLMLEGAHTRGLEGIHFHLSGDKPAKLEKGWLYIGLPTRNAAAGIEGRFGKIDIEGAVPKGAVIPARFNRGIPDDKDRLHFATYGPQSIFVRLYPGAHVDQFAAIICTAIRNGAQIAMEAEPARTEVDAWVKVAIDEHNEGRKEKAEKVHKDIEKDQEQVRGWADQIIKAQQKIQEHNILLDGLKKKVNAKDILLKYPALASVEYINEDDPFDVQIHTKELHINGVNLGRYRISLVPEKVQIVVYRHIGIEGLTHPNLYKKGDQWQWDIDPADMTTLIADLAAGKLASAAHITLNNLSKLYVDDKEHQDRLDKIKELMNGKAQDGAKG